MPVSLTSRYTGVPVQDVTNAQGEVHPTIMVRPFTPPGPDTTLYRHTLVGLETIEYLAWRFYGSSSDWWRIAEANPLVFPLDLSSGMVVAIPSPTDVGRIERTRSF